MSKNNNNIPKKKEIDFSAIDNLLFHTKSTHLENTQRKMDSLQERMSLLQQQQPVRNRSSFTNTDFCQICMFLMAAEIERLREGMGESIIEPMKKHVEGLQSSINQWRLRFEQKEQECEEMRIQLRELKQNSKQQANLQQELEKCQMQINSLLNENHQLNSKIERLELPTELPNTQLIKQLQSTIENQKSEIENKKQIIDNKNLMIQKLQEIQYKSPETQSDFDDLYRQLEQLQISYKNLYTEYKNYKNASTIFQDSPAETNNDQQLLIQKLQNENQTLKNQLYKQNRRVDTWCC